MPLTGEVRTRLLDRLRLLYGDGAADCLEQIERLAGAFETAVVRSRSDLWSGRDVVLITYGDQIRSPDQSPLQTLCSFLVDNGIPELVNKLHLLPFFPYSSDDGFSVVDYRRVDPLLGDWAHVRTLGHSFGLMFDLVLNHCSRGHRWFQEYLQGTEPYVGYFIEADPDADLSYVTRPRSSPLLTPVASSRGVKHVWTTFSADQIDLNFANPRVLLEFIEILFFYIQQGARIVRLDAIAYLWKQPGTPSIHLRETHLVVKLLRDLLDAFAPGTLLLTETNVPHAENVSYFGDGDEAHIVYQFSLAPLLLDAYLTGDGRPFSEWMSSLRDTRPGTAYLNFTASHDGIGVRPLEGLLSKERIDRLVESTAVRGGIVSTKRNPDGNDTPYELNITWFSALGDPEGIPPDLHVRRFLASQAVMLALRGIPAIYVHSLFGTPNDSEGVKKTGRARSINRRKFRRDELERLLSDDGLLHRRVFGGYKQLLAARIDQPAFHPNAAQQVLDTHCASLIAFLRTSLDGRQRILVVGNLAGSEQPVDLSRIDGPTFSRDLLTGRQCRQDEPLRLDPYQVAWLATEAI